MTLSLMEHLWKWNMIYSMWKMNLNYVLNLKEIIKACYTYIEPMKAKFPNHIIIIAYCLIISAHCCRQKTKKYFSHAQNSHFHPLLARYKDASYFFILPSLIYFAWYTHVCSWGKDMRKKSCMIKINRNYTQQRE